MLHLLAGDPLFNNGLDLGVVLIVAVGIKDRNTVQIGGEVVTL